MTVPESHPITTTTLDAMTLVENLASEGLIGMRAAAKLYGQAHDGKPVHPSTPTRHALHGIRLPGGRVLKLEVARIAGRIMTSRNAVFRFFAAQNEPAVAAPANAPAPETSRQLARKRSAATAKLDTILGTRRDSEGA